MGANNGQLASLLKRFDAFPKQREEAAEFFNRTSAGGAITIVSALFMALLFFSELRECTTGRLAGCGPGPPKRDHGSAAVGR